jgi:hypothetical protein
MKVAYAQTAQLALGATLTRRVRADLSGQRER